MNITPITLGTAQLTMPYGIANSNNNLVSSTPTTFPEPPTSDPPSDVVEAPPAKRRRRRRRCTPPIPNYHCGRCAVRCWRYPSHPTPDDLEAVIHSFSFAMIIGVIVGTYSSIFVASPVIIKMSSEKK